MRAVVFREHDKDPHKVLKVEDIDMPKIKPNEVLINVKAAACNYNDLWAIWGEPIKVPMPHISGSDAAGEVVEVGEDVTTFKKGDRVVSHSNMSCRVCYACTSGREYDCPNRIIWGFQTGPLWGGFSEYTHLPEVNVAHMPKNATFEEAAAVSMVGMTAWHMLVGRAKIHPGQTVLIMGGSSGVGSVGVQIAKIFNCTVIATAGNDEKLQKCKELGADYAVNHSDPEWFKKVREITNKQGVDVIFEHIGQVVWDKEIALLKTGGTLVTTGATTGYDAKTDLRYIFFKGLNILGSTQGTKAELMDVLSWVEKGKIRPAIDTKFLFEEAPKAHERMMSRQAFGKILIVPKA